MLAPCVFTIFGATGHLSRTKLLPALFDLHKEGRLPDGIAILCVGRRPWDSPRWREEVARFLREKTAPDSISEAEFAGFLEHVHYFLGDIEAPDCFPRLRETLETTAGFASNFIFYLSLPPAEYKRVARLLADNGLNDETGGWRRLVIEKPFGYDLEDAESLDQSLRSRFAENQLYRIDHYLGKETVQNVFVFRFANLMMEPLWNRNYIDHVQISHSETAGIEDRAEFYDGAGALRDMIQSHLLQLLTLVAMEPPPNLDAESIRDEKVKVLKSIRPIPKNAVHAHAFRAQYGRGQVDGKPVQGYLEEKSIPRDSTTETFAAVKLYLDNWRWRSVPFYLRTGKRLADSHSAISIRFRHPPQQLFRETQIAEIAPNWLLLGIQPEPCIRAEVQIREPGIGMRTRTTLLDATTSDSSGHQPDAYAALLLDVIEGDHSQFLRSDEVNWAWKVVDPILKVWAVERDFIHTYPAGSWGPMETNRLFEKENQCWRNSLSIEFCSV
ncbi:MAG: glucose-6-phosphate dehydrogenase [Proteobacteria bacterium]|nr:glucose-6-phosphate dehydrogenase [Pseudomonadota bacterium]